MSANISTFRERSAARADAGSPVDRAIQKAIDAEIKAGKRDKDGNPLSPQAQAQAKRVSTGDDKAVGRGRGRGKGNDGGDAAAGTLDVD